MEPLGTGLVLPPSPTGQGSSVPFPLAEPAQGRPFPAGMTVTCPVLTEALARGGPTITSRVLSPLDPDTVLLRGRKPRKRSTHIRISCCPAPPARRILPGCWDEPSPARREWARQVPAQRGFPMQLQSQRSRFSVCVPRVDPGAPPGFGQVTDRHRVLWVSVSRGQVLGRGGRLQGASALPRLCASWSVSGSSYASHLPRPPIFSAITGGGTACVSKGQHFLVVAVG